ncbi:hypothetical protein MA16_Dca007449 [Dendrobium catenatum]|uniref:Uncharacterized protein n=1 Tax=Dendrobium catenatum TaxID=906689 RepID=A0A2I0WAN7_9ASPA|nr:hypothetical protein MA16_Dca007449 [Dendrobium catenatum]
MRHFAKSIHNYKNRVIFLEVTSKPKMKSIEIFSQGLFGIGRGVYKPEFCAFLLKD